MQAAIRILGVDPGLRATGWGVVAISGNALAFIASGTVKAPLDGELARRLLVIHEGLSAVVGAWRPDEAAVEQTFVNRDAGATLKLGQARGIAMLAPALLGLPIAEYAPNAVKKTVVGAGHAGKDQIRAMVTHLLPRASFDSTDAADALAIAITHAHGRTFARLEARIAAELRDAP
jgi:crossover junction endodeoxyribonuclease RuvC